MLRRIKKSVLLALFIATGLSIFPLVISLVTKSWYFERYHATTWQIVTTYYVGAILVALPVSLLLPFAKKQAVAALLGVFGGVVLFSIVGYSMEGCIRWSSVLPLGILMGIPLGLLLRSALLAQLRKTTVKAQMGEGPAGCGLALSLIIDDYHPIEKEMGMVNEYFVHWLQTHGTECRELSIAVEADSKHHEQIVTACKRLLNQDLGMYHVISLLHVTVELFDPVTREEKALDISWTPPTSGRETPPPLPNDDSRYLPKL